MATHRSPSYPAIPLGEAVERSKKIWEQDGQAPITSEVAVIHMGYKKLHGASRTSLAALKKFGFIAGRGDEVRVTNEAVSIFLEDPEVDSKAKRQLLISSLILIPAFADIYDRYALNGSEQAIRAFFAKNGFSPDGSTSATKSYLESVEYIIRTAPVSQEDLDEDNETDNSDDEYIENANKNFSPNKHLNPYMKSVYDKITKERNSKKPPERNNMRQATHPFAQGDMVLAWPANLSLEDVPDVELWLDMMKKQVKKLAERNEIAKQDEISNNLSE